MSSLVIAIFLLSIGASFVQRTTGFGFGIFIMTMLPFFLPTYGEATTLSGLLAITTSAVIVWRMRSYVTWKRLWPILLTFIVVSTIAIFALTRIEDHILKRILGVALIVISIYFALFSQKIKLPTFFLILYSKGLFVFMQRNLSKSRGKKNLFSSESKGKNWVECFTVF